MQLSNVRIVLPDRVIERGAILIEDGRIAAISEAGSGTGPARDLTGLTLFPGFIDVHIHGAAGIDTLDAGPEELAAISKFLARHGVTGWLPTLVPAPAEQYEQAIRAIEVAQTLACDQVEDHRLKPVPLARILGVHYEGPFVNSEQCGALRREYFRKFVDPAELDSLPTIENEKAVHMMTVAPEIEGGIELISALRGRGWIVSIGHTRATPEILDASRDAGALHMTHFMNAMSPLHHRAPGPVGWGLLNNEVSVDVIADGVHLDPLTLKVLLRCKAPSRMALISDSISAAGRGDGEFEIWGEKIAVKNSRTQNARGNIAGSVITMLDAARMMRSLGPSECDVAQMASTNPALLLRIGDDCGSIEQGKRADLVALDDEGQVQFTLVGGEIAFDTQK